jgi:drug/metabolite transporter (DMT)-like permease
LVTLHKKPNPTTIVAGLLTAVFLWGASNTAVKYLVKSWPPIFAGSSRFLIAGFIFCFLLRKTKIFGETHTITPELNRSLWLRGGLSLTAYMLSFYWALQRSSVAHVTLCIGASPVWALLWEGRPQRSWLSFQRYAAAALAFCGVTVLLWPAVRQHSLNLTGDLLGVLCSFLWALFGHQCRILGRNLTGPEISAQTFWRVGVILAPFAIAEMFVHIPPELTWLDVVKSPSLIDFSPHALPLNWKLLFAQVVCILGGSIVAFALWNGALRHWKTSQVYLFNNFVPVTSMAWAYFCLGEQITATFWRAMILIVASVLLGQANLQSLYGRRWIPAD